MRQRVRAVALTVAALLWATVVAADCNGAPEPCRIAEGTYSVVLPDGAKGPIPAIVFLHGYGGDGEGTLRNRGMVDQMLKRGYAVIAPDGQPLESGKGRAWAFHPDRPSPRDETAFLIAVADDAAARFGLKRDRMLLAGFSIGGSMVSYVACQAPEAFAAFAPVAGSFWQPLPDSCAGPVRLLHTHGTADQTVPLLGREVMPGLVQGNVFAAMALWRVTNGCASSDPDRTERRGIFEIRRWKSCLPGAELTFALHDGGHDIPKGWATMAIDWFEDR
ncbi:MAG: alpha/beta fold hydrolase [Tabrizicola sp.]|nr:alpha/beta fold hydrolase [Tabrizicola sp.]